MDRSAFRVFIGSVVVVVLAAVFIYSCVPPAPPRAVKEPHGGTPPGGRVAVVYSKRYQINLAGLEKLHPFDINKYARIYLQLNADGLIRPEDVHVPREIPREDILLVHTEEYLDDLKDSGKVARYLEAGFASLAPPKILDLSILRAFRHATGGTLLAARLALEHGIAVNLGGGYSESAWRVQYESIRNIVEKHGLAGGGPHQAPRRPAKSVPETRAKR